MAVEGDRSSVLKNSKNSKTRARTRVFRVRERERERVEEEMPAGGACGPQEGGWRDQELGRATWHPGLGVDPPGQPHALPDGFLPGNFYFEFSGIFWATSL